VKPQLDTPDALPLRKYHLVKYLAPARFVNVYNFSNYKSYIILKSYANKNRPFSSISS
jgi:hypothetical protein